MGLAQDIIRRIKVKQAEIQAIDEQIKKLEIERESAKAYIQGLMDILPKAEREEGDIDARTKDLRPGSAPDQVRRILQEASHPMHINELLSALGRQQDKGSRAALGGTLARLARDGVVFEKVGPNTYGLIGQKLVVGTSDGELDEEGLRMNRQRPSVDENEQNA